MILTPAAAGVYEWNKEVAVSVIAEALYLGGLRCSKWPPAHSLMDRLSPTLYILKLCFGATGKKEEKKRKKLFGPYHFF
jgi:hypothetical protein